MKKLNLLILLFLIAYSVSIQAESFYVYTGFGLAKNKYPENTQNKIDKLDDQPHYDGMMSVKIELGGYWPGYKLITSHGPVFRAMYDAPVYYTRTPNVEMSVKTYALSYSALHFISDKVGKGIFIRGDVGVGMRNVSHEDKVLSQSTSYKEYGLSVLAGVGYGVKLSLDTYGLMGVNYSTITNFSQKSDSFAFMWGVFW